MRRLCNKKREFLELLLLSQAPRTQSTMSHYVPIPVSHWDIKRTKKHGEEGGGGGGGGDGGGGGGGGGVSHLRNHSNYEIAELTWENGQLAMHELGGLMRPNPSKLDSNRKPESKLNWDHTGGTLESVVHQVPNNYHEPDDVVAWFPDYAQKAGLLRPASSAENDRNQAHIVPVVGSISGINTNSLDDHSWKVTINQSGRELAKTGTWPEYGLPPPGLVDAKANRSVPPPSSEELADTKANRSVSMSGSATLGREADTTLMTWASFESPTSMRTNCTDKADCTSKCKRKSEADADDDWACRGGRQRNPGEERDNKGESGRSLSRSTKRSRAAAVHNQSERRRRDRINQRMKALQKLVPNSSKTDKASMLDEVIEYLKQLQTQLQMMSIRSMPHMMMPMGLQQQLQMSYMARMGMGMGLGMGMGMMDMSPVGHAAAPTIPPLIHPATAAAAFVPPPLVAPPLIPTTATRNANLDPISSPSASMPDPYSTFLAQSMNLDLYQKMTALYQQMHQPGHANSPPHINGNLKE